VNHRSEIIDTLLTIKGCLTPEQFTVVILKTVKGMTYPNVGDHIGKSASSARLIHGKALCKLNQKFRGYGHIMRKA
jgi:DNA-directed RNA polymerase specialized sigma24 family protein